MQDILMEPGEWLRWCEARLLRRVCIAWIRVSHVMFAWVNAMSSNYSNHFVAVRETLRQKPITSLVRQRQSTAQQ